MAAVVLPPDRHRDPQHHLQASPLCRFRRGRATTGRRSSLCGRMQSRTTVRGALCVVPRSLSTTLVSSRAAMSWSCLFAVAAPLPPNAAFPFRFVPAACDYQRGGEDATI
ncbi:ATP-dependent DNA-helicase RecQ [Sesbania bispinosa]|nr:ATP-dependent DNA-helicase RecQ [Sesbania bispinosa]